MAIAIGQMGLGLEDFLNLAPFEFEDAHEAWIEKIRSDREWQENNNWQIARWQVWRTLCPPEGKTLSVMDMIELPGDASLKKAAKETETNEEKWEKAKKRMGVWKC